MLSPLLKLFTPGKGRTKCEADFFRSVDGAAMPPTVGDEHADTVYHCQRVRNRWCVESSHMGNRSISLLAAQGRPERRSDDERRAGQAGGLPIKFLQHAAAEERTVAQTCRYCGISRKTYYKWKLRQATQGDAVSLRRGPVHRLPASLPSGRGGPINGASPPEPAWRGRGRRTPRVAFGGGHPMTHDERLKVTFRPYRNCASTSGPDQVPEE